MTRRRALPAIFSTPPSDGFNCCFKVERFAFDSQHRPDAWQRKEPLSAGNSTTNFAEAKAACQSESFPAEFADRLLSGESPLRVWRDYRGLTLQSLAETCGATRQMLSIIQHGKTKPSAALLGKLAGALDCDMDDLHV
jgi:DNA-binding XRE family transcriptional regulator